MRLVRFSSSPLELGRSDPHSDVVFVDDASLRLVRFFLLFLIWNWTVYLVLNSSRNGENRDHAISNLQRNEKNRGVFGRENRDGFGRVSSRLQIGEQHSSSSSTGAFERVSPSLQIGEQHSSSSFAGDSILEEGGSSKQIFPSPLRS